MNGYLVDWSIASIERVDEMEYWKLGPPSREPLQGGLVDYQYQEACKRGK